MSMPSKETVIRTVLLVLALINNTLALFGKSPIPIDDESIKALISIVFTIGAAVSAWWFNNSYTLPAQLADECMKTFKQREKAEKREKEDTCEE